MVKKVEFGKNLKVLRNKSGLTRNELAAKFSYSSKAIEKWEAGVSLPPLVIISELSDFFGVSLEELVYKKSDIVRYFLGIDGGGKTTSFLLVNEKSEKVADFVLDASNPIDVGIDNCKRVLSSGIETVCYGIDKSEISVFAGISGIEGPDTEKFIYNHLLSMRFNAVGVANEIENVIELALDGSDGIAMICGTGVAAYVISDGKRFKISGNGYLFDNGGSGYDIGRDAFEAAFKHIDGRGEETLLTGMLEEKLGGPLPQSIDKIYKGGKRYIASASDLVFGAYNKGDKVAEKIIKKNADAIAEIINAGLKHFDSKSVKVTICGGLVSQAKTISKCLKPCLSPKCNLMFVDKPGVLGAVKRAQKQVNDYE